MSAKTHHFRIGLFVLAGAGLFVAALFAVGLKAYFGERDIFETYVPGKAENLSVGALVKLRGVTIGKVSAIEFIGVEYPQYHQRYVLIQFEVPREQSGARKRTTSRNCSMRRLRRVFARGCRRRVSSAPAFSRLNMWTPRSIPSSQYPGRRSTITFLQRRASSTG